MEKTPDKRVFLGQDESEVVQRVIYKHIFSVLPVLLVAGGLFILGLSIFYTAVAGHSFDIPLNLVGTGNLEKYGVPLLPLGLILIVLSILLGVAGVYIWRQNKMIVTDENIVDMDQTGLFGRVIATLRLSRVQDISVKVKGPMQTIFQYGTISIETAGEEKLFTFDYVPTPYIIKTFIQNTFEKFVEHKGENDGTGLAEAEKADLDEGE